MNHNDRLILGDGFVFSTDVTKTGLNNNLLVVGCTGSGKSMSIEEPCLLDMCKFNRIETDPKGVLKKKYKCYHESLGYKVLELNLSDHSKSDISIDPLKYVESDEDVTNLAQSIVNLTPQRENSSADSFWDNSAVNVMKYAIYRILAFQGEEGTLVDVVKHIKGLKLYDNGDKLLTCSESSFLAEFEQNYPNHPMIEAYNSFADNPIRTAGCIFSTIKTTLSCVFTDELLKAIRDKKQFDLKELTKKKYIIYITTNGVNEYMNAYANLIIELIINQLTKYASEFPNNKLPIPVHIGCDDFACGTKIKSFPLQIAKFRSLGISSTIVLQSLSQLASLYGERGAQTIINNNDTIVYLGGNEIDTAANFARRLNVPLDRVLYMPVGEVMIFRRGQKPIITNRYKILEDKRYKDILEKNDKITRQH